MIIALLFLILFAILFPKALRFLFALLFLGAIIVLGEVHAATNRESTDQLISSYAPTKARCIKYGNGIPLNYDAGDRGERDCEDLGYIIKTLTGDGCHYKHNRWECY
jgi:hypothetical protein